MNGCDCLFYRVPNNAYQRKACMNPESEMYGYSGVDERFTGPCPYREVRCT